MESKHFENKARQAFWSIHVEAWRRSGLSRAKYCRDSGLTKGVFNRWLKRLESAEAVRLAAELQREQRRLRRRRGASPLCKSKRVVAVQAFWAMHVEALTWSGLTATHYADAHHLSAYSLRRWRDLLESGEVDVDWRARLHPSARAIISTGASSAAKKPAMESTLTEVSNADPAPVRCANRRSFTDEEKLAIVLEAEPTGVSVAEVCRRHGIATSMVFRWRVQFGFAQKKTAKLATVVQPADRSGGTSPPVVLHDVLQPPDGMIAVELRDGRRVFAPIGADPETVRKFVAEREAAP